MSNKYTETRTISMTALRNLCIKNDWYTSGTSEEYDKLLVSAANLVNVTTEDLEWIAKDIMAHSDDIHSNITDVMWGIAHACCEHIELA